MSDVTLPPVGRAPLPTLPAPELSIASNVAAAQPMPGDAVASGQVHAPNAFDALRVLEHSAPSGVAFAGGPVAEFDGRSVELTRYEQSGKVQVDGDAVTQQLGRGHTAKYSLGELAAHSKDPDFFVNTMTYAAKRGDSVTIDVHSGVSRVTDPALEHRLPRNFPYGDAILHASVKHQIDPALLAAVGEQESGMGKGAYYNPTTHIGGDGHGHGMWQIDDRYNSIADCERAGRDPYFAADKAARQLSGAIAREGLASGIQSYNGNDAALPYYHLVKAHLNAIEGRLSQEYSMDRGR